MGYIQQGLVDGLSKMDLQTGLLSRHEHIIPRTVYGVEIMKLYCNNNDVKGAYSDTTHCYERMGHLLNVSTQFIRLVVN